MVVGWQGEAVPMKVCCLQPQLDSLIRINSQFAHLTLEF